MANSTLSQQHPLALQFDAFPSYQTRQSAYADFSPASLYSPLEDFGTDFTTDSAASPDSAMSPPFTGSYALPGDNDWMSWDTKIEQSPESQFLKPEILDSPILASIPPRDMPISPAVNPMDLGNPAADDVVIFGQAGLDDTQPLFQSLPQRSQRSQPSRTKPILQSSSPATKPAPAASMAPQSQPSTRNRKPAERYPSRSLKRKSTSSTASSDDEDRESSPPPARRASRESRTSATAALPKKTAHNMIEKRYRNNLNDKIASLRDAVPALRVMANRLEPANSSGEGGGDERLRRGSVRGCDRRAVDEEAVDLGGLAPAHKLNKATILSKATEYIVHLEKRNQNLASENDALRTRVESLEMMVMGRPPNGAMWN